jgi:mandelate racemase
MRVGSSDWRNDVERVQRVRSALPPDTDLLVDANQGWSVTDALAACSALDDIGLYWIEEPVDALNFAGCAAVADAIETPVAAGESLFEKRELLGLVDAVEVLMPDLQHCGGPSGFLDVLRDPAFGRMRISNHLFVEVSVHLLAVCPNAEIAELMPGWWDELFDRPLDVVDGTIAPPEEPGIGYRFSEQAQRFLNDI